MELLELLAGRSLVALCWDGEQLCYHCVLSTSWVPGSSFAHWSHCISGAVMLEERSPKHQETGAGGELRRVDLVAEAEVQLWDPAAVLLDPIALSLQHPGTPACLPTLISMEPGFALHLHFTGH